MGPVFHPHLRIMLAALVRNRVRALLALGSVGLGVAAVTLSMALGTGARQELDRLSASFGRHLLVINAASTPPRPGSREGWRLSTRLVMADVRLLTQELPSLVDAVPVIERSARLKYQRTEHNTTVRGTTAGYFLARNYALAEGRALDEADEVAGARVVVVGAYVADKLGASGSLVGERIWVAGAPFEVVGELARKGVSADGSNQDDFVVVPLRTMQRRIANTDALNSVLLRLPPSEPAEEVGRRVGAILRSAHAIALGQKDDFELVSAIKADEVARVTANFLNGLARIFAAITLSVGGVGVFAVTFMNVKDRVGEIGLRMAIGARRRDIARMFMFEACLMAAAGGVAGLALGALAVAVLRRLTDWQMAFDWLGAATPLAVSVLIGLVFGVWPAMRAAGMTVTDALRSG